MYAIRSYYAADGTEAALEEVRSRAGTWFDPVLAKAFERVAANDAFWATLRDPDIDSAVFALEPGQHEVSYNFV